LLHESLVRIAQKHVNVRKVPNLRTLISCSPCKEETGRIFTHTHFYEKTYCQSTVVKTILHKKYTDQTNCLATDLEALNESTPVCWLEFSSGKRKETTWYINMMWDIWCCRE
jgi:hypothetical protein